MQQEISAASAFLVNIIARHPRHDELTQAHIDAFAKALTANMNASFAPSWRPENPLSGSANRCIRINFGLIDAVVMDAAKEAGIAHFISKILPSELTMWVDPGEVSYKFNDRSPPFTIWSSESSEATEPPMSPQLPSPSTSPVMRSATSSPTMFYVYPNAPSPAVPVM